VFKELCIKLLEIRNCVAKLFGHPSYDAVADIYTAGQVGTAVSHLAQHSEVFYLNVSCSLAVLTGLFV
jgi:hypothetical protein